VRQYGGNTGLEVARAFNGFFGAKTETNKYKDNKETEEEKRKNDETSSKSKEVIIRLHNWAGEPPRRRSSGANG
jgi:hypothetical protein